MRGSKVGTERTGWNRRRRGVPWRGGKPRRASGFVEAEICRRGATDLLLAQGPGVEPRGSFGNLLVNGMRVYAPAMSRKCGQEWGKGSGGWNPKGVTGMK
jgi:hypothetical protein